MRACGKPAGNADKTLREEHRRIVDHGGEHRVVQRDVNRMLIIASPHPVREADTVPARLRDGGGLFDAAIVLQNQGLDTMRDRPAAGPFGSPGGVDKANVLCMNRHNPRKDLSAIPDVFPRVRAEQIIFETAICQQIIGLSRFTPRGQLRTAFDGEHRIALLRGCCDECAFCGL